MIAKATSLAKKQKSASGNVYIPDWLYFCFFIGRQPALRRKTVRFSPNARRGTFDLSFGYLKAWLLEGHVKRAAPARVAPRKGNILYEMNISA